MNSFYDNFKKVQKQTIKAAKELLYSPEIIEKLNNAKSTNELANIMKTARGNMLND